ncbi:MAG: YceH family protein [Patulibacter minatonensis]
MELDPFEQRVLGCLIEKRVTTPDVYPLSMNALRSACNQSTNRDPVMQVTDDEVRDACQGLYRAGLARLSSGAGSRTIKYRHLAHEALNVGDAELALIAVLLLRGPQTVGELRTRTERLHPFESLGSVTAVLDQLGRRGLVVLLEREPGRKEPRYAHCLGARQPGDSALIPSAAAPRPAEDAPAATPYDAPPIPDVAPLDGPRPAAPPAAAAAPTASSAAPLGPPTSELEARIAALEARVADLEALL